MSVLLLLALFAGWAALPAWSVQAVARAGGPPRQNPTPPPEGPPDLSQEGPPPPQDYLQDEEMRFERISVEQGLSQSSVQSIFQDAKGFMWFATQDGLNRYDGYDFEVYKPVLDDPSSISQQFIRSVIEDHASLMWIGTDSAGLNRFDRDKREFMPFRYVEGDASSLSSDFVNVVYEDREGVLWVGTRDGLNRLEPENMRFVRYRAAEDNPYSLSDDQVMSVFEDSQGVLWVGTNRGGLNAFDRATGRFKHYRYDPNNPGSLGSGAVECIYEDRFGALWVGTRGGGLNRFNRLSEAFTRYVREPSDPYSLSSDQVTSIYEDNLGDLWVGTYGGGLNRFDRGQERFYRYRHAQSDQYSLSNDFVLSIYEDRTGVLWIGTQGGGLNKVERLAPRFTHIQARTDDIFGNINALNNDVVWAIYEDRDGALWVGTNGGGLNKWDRKNGQWYHYQHDPANRYSLSNDVVQAIVEDKQGRLWIGTEGGGLNRFERRSGRFYRYQHDDGNPNTLSEDSIQCLYIDHDGVLWIGTKNNGLDRYDGVMQRFIHYTPDEGDSYSLSSPYIRAIYEDSQGDLWIGTRNGGLNALNRESGRFEHYHAAAGEPDSLSSNYVISIYEDRQGTLWFGTFGGGLNKFDRQLGTFRHYRMQDGLPSDIIYGILEDNQGFLWLSTNNGLAKFDPKGEAFVSFGVDDGLQSTEFASGAYFKGGSGEMFFGGIHGFNLFDPENIGEGNPHIPPVVVASLTQDGMAIEAGQAFENLEQVTLHWPKNRFEFEFVALSYIHPEKNQYAYRLDGYDQKWFYLGSKRSGRYSDLPGGAYTLRMKASNNDGVWNETGASLQVVVKPPFWQDRRYQVSGLLALAFCVIAGYLVRVRSVEARSRDLTRQIEERTEQLLNTNRLLEREILERKRVEQELSQQAVAAAVAAERSRLARELHDAVTQTLFSASLIAEALPASWDNDPREGRALLGELRQLSKGALAEMRTLLLELRPGVLVEVSLDDLLRQLAEAASGREGIPVKVSIQGQDDLPRDVHIVLYRIAQEALNNVVKHARASAVEVRLAYGGADRRLEETLAGYGRNGNHRARVSLSVQDDGRGFDPRHISADHLGLEIMRERARSIGARLTIDSRPGRGTQVRVDWLEREPEEQYTNE